MRSSKATEIKKAYPVGAKVEVDISSSGSQVATVVGYQMHPEHNILILHVDVIPNSRYDSTDRWVYPDEIIKVLR